MSAGNRLVIVGARSHRGQRRHGEQDRHLLRRGAGEASTSCRSTWRRRFHVRSLDAGRRHIPIEQRVARGDPCRRDAAAPEVAPVRNPAFDVTPAAYHRHHHRARHLPRALHGVAAAGIQMHECARCRDVLRRNVGRGRDRDRRRRQPWRIQSNIVASQVEIDSEWGEWCPRSRRGSTCATSVEWWSGRSRRRGRAGSDLDAVAVTQGPGLVGSLLVGVAFAKAAARRRKPRRRRPPSGGAHRIAEARARRDADARDCARCLGWPYEPVFSSRTRGLPPGRPNERRRGGRRVRQGGKAAGPWIPGWADDRQGWRAGERSGD